MSIITLSHEAFGDGRAVAERVAAILGYRCISREVLVKASQRYGVAETKLFEVLEEKPRRWWAEWLQSRGMYRIVLQAALCELAQEGNIVYHGRAGQEFFPGIRHVLNVFVDTPTESRIKQVMARKGLAEEAARKFLEESDTIRARRIKELFKVDWRDRYGTALNAGVLTGVLGGYTTFSSMQLDAVKLAGRRGHVPAASYLLLSVSIGQLAAALGGTLARAQG